MTASVSPLPSARGRLLPHSLEAERAVIGMVLLSPKAFLYVADILRAEDFYHPSHQAIYQAMADLDEAGTPIDHISLAVRMKQADTWDKLRGVEYEAYLAVLQDAVITADEAHVKHHASIVADKAQARRLIEAGHEIIGKGYGDYGTATELLEEAEGKIFAIAMRSHVQAYEPIRTVLDRTVRNIEARFNRKSTITGVPTGFTEIDELTAGLQPADLVIVAARPSMGKTSFAMNCVAHATLCHGLPCLVFSVEMSGEALAERIICSEARISSSRLRTGMLTAPDWVAITKVMSRIKAAPIWVDDPSAMTLADMRTKARRWRSDPKVFPDPNTMGMIVVDYLQLLHGKPGASKDTTREREIADITRGMKALAKETRCPVVALSQLNRALESRANKRPVLSDLRESGAIEQDADLIAFLYRDEVYDAESKDAGTAEVIIGKQRNGAVGVAKLAFLKEYTRFENLARRAAEDAQERFD